MIKTEIILFLNKKDVFIEKFGRGDFKKYVKKYTGPDDEPDKAIEHLKINVFEEVRSFFKVNFKKPFLSCLDIQRAQSTWSFLQRARETVLPCNDGHWYRKYQNGVCNCNRYYFWQVDEGNESMK